MPDKQQAAEDDVCECGHYRFVHPGEGPCKPMGRDLLRNPCRCKGFTAVPSAHPATEEPT